MATKLLGEDAKSHVDADDQASDEGGRVSAPQDRPAVDAIEPLRPGYPVMKERFGFRSSPALRSS